MDLKKALQEPNSDPCYLEPSDIVFVPRTAIDRVDQWVDQYINQVVPRNLQYSFNNQTGSQSNSSAKTTVQVPVKGTSGTVQSPSDTEIEEGQHIMRSDFVRTSIRDILYVLFRHKKKMMAVFAITAVSVTVVTFLMKDVYRSDAVLLIRLGRENLGMDPSVSGPTVSIGQDRASEVNSEVNILTSRYLVEQVVDSLGDEALSADDAQGGKGWLKNALSKTVSAGRTLLESAGLSPKLAPREKAIVKFTKNLSVEVEPKTNVVQLNFDAPNAALAQSALDRLVQAYLDRHITVHAAQASPKFFETQVETLESQLTQHEQELEAFRKQYGIVSIESQKENLLQQIGDLRTEVDDIGGQVDASQAQQVAIEKALKKRPAVLEVSRTTGRTNYAADALKGRLLELKLKETDLSSRYPDDYRPLILVREQIGDAEKMLTKEEETHTEVTTGVDAAQQSMQQELESQRTQAQGLMARKAAMSQDLARLQDRLDDLSSHETELTRLQRNVDLALEEYKQYRDNLQRARISTALDIDKVSNVSVVQPATHPLDPVKPKKLLNIAFGLVLGLLAGVGCAFVAEYFDESIRRDEDIVERLGVPLLTVVTEEEYKACI